MKLTIISPTYNEAENVGPLIERVSIALPDVDHEIVIVDDNSPDRTWAVAEEIRKSNNHVRVIRRMHDHGLSPAVIEGFASARGEMVACIDADLQHDPKILRQMYEAVAEGSDVAVGSRYVPGGGTGDWNVVRRFESWVATKMAQVLLGVQLQDPMSGYFLMRRQDFLRVQEELDAKGFKILLEIVAKLRPNKVEEVPYTFRVRQAGESKLSGKVVAQYLGQIWRLSKLGKLYSDRFLKFALVGASGIIVNLITMALLMRTGSLRDWRVSAIASLVANFSNYVLNNSWTFADRVHKGWAVIRGYFSYLVMSTIGLLVSTTAYAGLTWSAKRLLDSSASHAAALLLSWQFLAIVLGTYFNYQLNKHITWPHSRSEAGTESDRQTLQVTAGMANQESHVRP